MTELSQTLHVYSFRVRIPLAGGASLWQRHSGFGVDEDDAAREVIERFPEAVELEGAPMRHDKPTIICDKLLQADAIHWCRYCGQDGASHPITSASPRALEAREWIDTIEREGAFMSNVAWDGESAVAAKKESR